MKSTSSLRRRLSAAAVSTTLVVTGLGFAAGPVSAQSSTTACGDAPQGYNVIESNAAEIDGTAGNDYICAGNGANDIFAKGGDDIVFGRGGDDTINGGLGADTIDGGDGDDTIKGGNKKFADILSGGPGDDTIRGLGGADQIFGGEGNDTIQGGGGGDLINGGPGNDFIKGKPGNDTINGDSGDDKIQGGGGKDTINGGTGADKLTGGKGNDLLDGADGDDILRGNDGDDRLFGNAGADKLVGGNGDDELNGGTGDDNLNGQTDTDTADGGPDTDVCSAETETNCETGTGGGDADGDGVPDTTDNCVNDANADQANNDGDAEGDVCDTDDDNDTILDGADNCPTDANTDQADADSDGAGDVCDPTPGTDDADGDGIVDGADTIPNTKFEIDPFGAVKSSGGWTPDGDITVTIAGGDTLDCRTNASGDLGGKDPGGGYIATGCEITNPPAAENALITVTDVTNGAVKTTTISTKVDRVTRWDDMVAGTAPAGATVSVKPEGTGAGCGTAANAIASPAGDWVVDFGGTCDIDVINTNLGATATYEDADGDTVVRPFFISNAGITTSGLTGTCLTVDVDPTDNFDWTPGQAMDLELFDDAAETTSLDTDAPTSSGNGTWSGSLTHSSAIAAGMKVKVTDPGTGDVFSKIIGAADLGSCV